jgi:hypothetical protein
VSTLQQYLTLKPAQRDRVRSAVRDLAVRGNEHYADLLAAEAVLTARAEYPDTHQLVFQLSDDITGTTAMLGAAYDRDATPLWRLERDDEWPDESQVTDLLAASADRSRDYHPFNEARDDSDLAEYELPAIEHSATSPPTGAER